MNKQESLDHQTFGRLSKIYSIALGAIALFSIGSQFFIQKYLNSQIDDSRIINISGRQRMLSQKISKDILVLCHLEDEESKIQYASDLESTLDLWKESHEVLLQYNESVQKKNRDSSEIRKMFSVLEPYFQNILQSSTEVLNLVKNDSIDAIALKTNLDTVLLNEPLFLEQMNAVVFQYDKDAKQKVSSLKRIEYLLFCIIILILVSEFFLLFRPAAIRIKKTISNLLISQEKAESMASRTEVLRKIQEENVQELLTLTKAINQTLLYARVDKAGLVIDLGERFGKLLQVDQDNKQKSLADLMRLNEVQKSRLLELISQNKGGVFNEEFELQIVANQKIWLDVSIYTVFKESGKSERLVLCSDISKRKEAQNEVERLNAKQYKEKEELQKSNASQIVEAQEEERKRIAKEIHDSIGQMLTALKFNIESINLKNIEKAGQKIEGLKKVSKDLIQGIRMATFNLTPPELKDYGIPIALQKMARELSKLTGKNIIFENKSNFEQRFDTLVETNLYRVTQEAVNNAIKYANSDYVMISVNHSNSILSIIIDDNGDGFDIDSIPSKPKNNAEGGMGLFFMKERMNYIDGRIFINSIPGEGSRITLNYSI
ncbi:PAS domain-containing sensor histidine kinase [Aquimarina algiphila]|uniref:histidine kinase n=1 Tax=Aquimarina algiphila TaxID=2047982 RepID=A0A554VHY1_9FLAO|nr:type IV pili methyl-accepting chemotaxis transducer N-terminal domain-containing protein [Aquimarina algiphila]TSE07181.1 histidine kinase [Aquimarina algiphila]